MGAGQPNSHFWWRVQAKDAVGNWSVYGEAFELTIDGTAPSSDPSGFSSNPAVSTPSNDQTVDVSWTTGGVDALSGVDGYSYDFTQNVIGTPDQIKDIEESVTSVTSPTLTDGTWYFHIRTVDNAGNWTSTAHFGPFIIDTTAPATLTIVSGMKWNDVNSDRQTLGESGIAGWTINLFNADFDGEIFTATTLETSTPTDVNGNYSFSNLDPESDYIVCEETQSGWNQTSPISASDGTVICANGTVGYIAINNGAGQPRTFTNVNFGNHNTPAPLSGGVGGDGGGGGGGDVLSAATAPVCNDTKPGNAPVLLSAVAGFNSVTLTWAKASDPVSYYLMTFGTSSGAQTYGNPNIGDKDTTSYTVSGLSGGATYYFKIRAGNGCMPGDFSNEVSAAPSGGFVEGVPAGFEAEVLGEATKSGELVGEELTGEPTPTTAVINAGLVKGIESIAKNNFSKYILPIVLIILLTALIFYFYKKRKNSSS